MLCEVIPEQSIISEDSYLSSRMSLKNRKYVTSDTMNKTSMLQNWLIETQKINQIPISAQNDAGQDSRVLNFSLGQTEKNLRFRKESVNSFCRRTKLMRSRRFSKLKYSHITMAYFGEEVKKPKESVFKLYSLDKSTKCIDGESKMLLPPGFYYDCPASSPDPEVCLPKPLAPRNKGDEMLEIFLSQDPSEQKRICSSPLIDTETLRSFFNSTNLDLLKSALRPIVSSVYGSDVILEFFKSDSSVRDMFVGLHLREIGYLLSLETAIPLVYYLVEHSYIFAECTLNHLGLDLNSTLTEPIRMELIFQCIQKSQNYVSLSLIQRIKVNSEILENPKCYTLLKFMLEVSSLETISEISILIVGHSSIKNLLNIKEASDLLLSLLRLDEWRSTAYLASAVHIDIGDLLHYPYFGYLIKQFFAGKPGTHAARLLRDCLLDSPAEKLAFLHHQEGHLLEYVRIAASSLTGIEQFFAFKSSCFLIGGYPNLLHAFTDPSVTRIIERLE